MGLLVTGVTRIVELIYVITCIRAGWYKLFPQLVTSFSFITTTLQKELGPVSEYPHDVTAAILVFQTNPSLLYFRCILLLKMLCLLDLLCLLDMLCLLEVLCLLEMLCLLDVFFLLSWDDLLAWCALLTWDVKGSQRQTCMDSQSGFGGCVALSNAFELHFCSFKHVFQRFTSFVAYDRRSSKNYFQCLFKIWVICCNNFA